MPAHTLIAVFEVLALSGAGLTALKLYRSGLHRRYRAIFAYCTYQVPNASCALLLDTKSHAYFYFWLLTAPISWLFYTLMAFELYRLVLERYKGLYTLGRRAMYLGIAVSVTVSALTLLPRITPVMPRGSVILGYVMAADRGVDLSLAIFLLLMLFLLGQYPVPLCRNVVAHALILNVYFLSQTLVTLLHSVFGVKLSEAIDAGLMGISAACMLAWFILFSPEGEHVQLNHWYFGPKHEESILGRLDSLNQTLLRVSRKQGALLG